MRIAFGLLVTAALAAQGGSIFTDSAGGSSVAATNVTDSTVSGNQMGGMVITGTFTGGVIAQCPWINGAGSSGSCTAAQNGVGFLVSIDGDTFFGEWSLSGINGGTNSARLLTLHFNGVPGNTVFDRATGAIGLSETTPGSDIGRDATGSTSPGSVDGGADYLNPVGIQGNAPLNDIYSIVEISFDDLGMPTGSTATWFMDTDKVSYPAGAVPEPGTMGLMGVALAGLAIARRRSRKN